MPSTLLQRKLQENQGENIKKEDEIQKPDLMSTRYVAPVIAALSNQKKEKPKEESHSDKFEEDYEKNLLSEEDKRELNRIRRKKKEKIIGKVIQVILAIGCVYLVFLIYGALNTTFTYNIKGDVVPLVLSVDEIKSVADFTAVSGQYLQARTLYEKVLLLDYRLGSGLEDPLFIAPEYEKILEDVTKLSVQAGAITVPAQYTQPMNMLLSWVQNDIALYCQYISRAVTQNNVSDMNQAIAYKDIMYQNFMQLTEVVAKMGSLVENADIKNIVEWSPEKFIEQQTGGAEFAER